MEKNIEKQFESDIKRRNRDTGEEIDAIPYGRNS